MPDPLADPDAPDPAMFTPVPKCWVCGGEDFVNSYRAAFDLSAYAQQAPEIHAYTGSSLWMRSCRHCGFTQPEALPSAANYFDQIYDQHWSAEWIKSEFDSTYKDFIFQGLLTDLGRLQGSSEGHLLDIGAHVGRFIYLAKLAGWHAEGIELNPRTAAFAQERTGLTVHQINAGQLSAQKERYLAITLIDVLEHIPEPLRILRQAVELLQSGGCIAIKVPCGPAQKFKERIRSRVHKNYDLAFALSGNLAHLSYFSPRSLALALRNCGFEQIRIEVGAPELNDFERTPRTLMKRCSDVFRLAVYYAVRHVPGGMYSPLAFNLQAYARKP